MYKYIRFKKLLVVIGSLTLALAGSNTTYAYSKDMNLEQCDTDNPYHILVNNEHTLSSDYKPTDLIIPNVKFESSGNIEKNHMEATAGRALELMFGDANKEGVNLVAVSGYRSYSRQKTLYNNAIHTYGYNQKGTAKQGASEHQTGLSMDINSINQSFANTKEGKWLTENCYKYGFIIRYPEGKTHITGYVYEPWHIRYVGNELAEYCYTNKLTLEEVSGCCKENTKDIVYSNTGNTLYDTNLINILGKNYIRVRDLANLLNMDVQLEKDIVKVYNNNTIMHVTPSSNKIIINGVNYILDVKVLNLYNYTYVPFRDTLSILNLDLMINNDSKMVVVPKVTINHKMINNDTDDIDVPTVSNYTYLRTENGHDIYLNGVGEEITNGCNESCIYGYVHVIEKE